MLFQLFIFLLFYIVGISAAAPVNLVDVKALDNQIVKIESIGQISHLLPLTNLSGRVIYFFDIDDTLFDSPYMLGSKAWRKYIVEAIKKDPTYNWHDIFSLFIARNYPVIPIETATNQFVHDLQQKGYAVFGLTAREKNMWYDTPTADIDILTICQLESIGINFNQNPGNIPYSSPTNVPEYYKGVFFANLEPKGQYLLKLFKNIDNPPKKIIFIDDKQSQVESVATALNQLGIDHACYWYMATDEKASRFDPLIANIQLYYFLKSNGLEVLSDENAAAIATKFPERDAEYYLQAVLDNAKTKLMNGNNNPE